MTLNNTHEDKTYNLIKQLLFLFKYYLANANFYDLNRYSNQWNAACSTLHRETNECDLFSGSFRAAVVKLLELRASVFFPQQMKKWRPTDVSVFSREEERSRVCLKPKVPLRVGKQRQRGATREHFPFIPLTLRATSQSL